MAKPLPPTVYGPITPISPAVRVTGVLPGADVELLANGASVGYALATAAGGLWVPLTAQPAPGQLIAATQTTADGTSEPSPQPIPVIDVPDPLPVPVIFSDVNTCMVDIWAGALVPGAKVVTTIGGAPFGSIVAGQPDGWLGIDPAKGIAPGSRAELHQEATIGGALRVGNTVQSLPIPAFSVPGDLLPPPVLGPLTECDTFRAFTQVVPGASLTIANEGQSESWTSPSLTWRGNNAPPLRKGKAIATQTMPRCRRQGQPATLPVGPSVPPLQPTVSQEICPQVMRLTVGNLTPGAILYLYRRVDNSPVSWSQTLVGTLGIADPVQPVDLPSDLALSDPAGPVSLVIWQDGCGGSSPETIIKVAAASGPFGAPRIVEPLFDCCRAIPVTGAHPSSSVQAFDQKTGLPLSGSYPLWSAEATIPLWFPLVAGQRVFVRQRGCNADGDSPAVKVQALPATLPVPKIVEPVRPHAPIVNVTGVIPGARLCLMVNNQLRPGAVDVLADHGGVPVNGAPLAEKDRVFVIQALCDRLSNVEGPGVTVKRGKLNVSVAPPQVARGTTASMVVTAVDADTGASVSAQVMLKGANVGTTGVAFSYSPKAGDPNPAGVVHEPVAYVDAAFSITLVDPHWTLAMQAGPLPPVADTVVFSVDEVTWTVTPDWNAALVQKVVVHPSPPSATGSVSLPQPPGAVKTVTVTIAGKVSTAGGNLNGYAIGPGSFVLGTDSEKVGFHGPNERIGWLIQPHYIADGENIVITVDPTFAGINDF